LKHFYCLLFIFCCLSTAQAKVQVHSTTLDNGMKVFVQEDHRSPVVVSQIWYKAGALDEVNGKTGVAHLLEHMMFKGTKKVPVGQFSRIIAAAGGKENAFTAMDYTAYFQQLEKFAKEIQVVMEERRWRIDDKPRAQVNEQLNALAYRAHPYGRPIVGHMNDLENMTAEDAREWYNKFYSPNNASLVIVGDVDAKQVFALAKTHFGKIKEGVLPVRKPQIEPAQTGERRAVVKAPGKLPYLAMAFKAPSIPNIGKTASTEPWEPYALEVLASILSGNASSRLDQKLVRDTSLALSVGAYYGNTSRGQAATFELVGTPSEGKTVAQLEKAFWVEVERVKASGVTEAELNRVKAGVIAADVYQRDSMFYQAMQIGMLETMGYGWQLLNTYADALNAVTVEQVQAVANKYLVQDQMTVVTLDPQPIDPNKKPLTRRRFH